MNTVLKHNHRRTTHAIKCFKNALRSDSMIRFYDHVSFLLNLISSLNMQHFTDIPNRSHKIVLYSFCLNVSLTPDVTVPAENQAEVSINFRHKWKETPKLPKDSFTNQ